MDDTKREQNKTKRQKNDHVKNLLHAYLQRRNYAPTTPENCTTDQHLTYSRIENSISRPNSILYSCFNSDPQLIEHNFIKFIAWIRDTTKNRNICHDLELITAPLFLHAYLEILKGGHVDFANNFFRAHLNSIDKSKCDDFVRDLINLIAADADATCLKEQFRGHKYLLELQQQSLSLLKKFVQAHCNVVILYIFQTFFELRQVMGPEDESNDCQMREQSVVPATNGEHKGDKYQKIVDIIQELESEPSQILLIDISNAKEAITSATVHRSSNLIAYNQNNVVSLKSLHPLDSILGHDSKEIKIIEHSGLVYSIKLSADQKYLLSSSADTHLSIFNLHTMSLVKLCKGHLGPIYCIAISSNNTYGASGSQDLTARLWGLESGHNLRIFIGHSQAITCIDFHPNCLYLMTGSADKTVRLWSIDNGESLRLFHGSKGAIYALSFSPLGNVFASAGDDNNKKVKIWDALTGKVLCDFKYKGDPVTSLVWSADGRQLCGGAIDGYVRVWRVEKCLENSEKNQEPVQSFNVNSRILGVEFEFDTFACVTG